MKNKKTDAAMYGKTRRTHTIHLIPNSGAEPKFISSVTFPYTDDAGLLSVPKYLKYSL